MPIAVNPNTVVEGGKITTDIKSTTKAGDKINITFTPDKGYSFVKGSEDIKVTYEENLTSNSVNSNSSDLSEVSSEPVTIEYQLPSGQGNIESLDITGKFEKNAATDADESPDSSPSTGDNTPIMPIACTLAALTFGYIGIRKRCK